MNYKFSSIFLYLSAFLLGSCSGAAVTNADHQVVDTISTEITQIDSSNITCPICNYTTKEALPTEYCIIAYDCKSCGETIHPKVGDCCVFCTYGDVKCPSMQ